MSSPAFLPPDIYRAVTRGELQKLIKWLRKGGSVDALCSDDGQASFVVLHAASGCCHLEMVRELLKRGASVDLPSAPGARLAVAVGSGQSQTVAVGAAQRQPVAVPAYKNAFFKAM